MNKREILDRIYGRQFSCPLLNFEYDKSECDEQGWNSTHPALAEAIEKIKPKVILEAGVWKGASAIHMADSCRDLRVESTIIALDSWLGNHILYEVSEWVPSLRLNKDGRAQIYRTFYANVCENKMQDYFVPVHMDTASGLRMCKRRSIYVDMIHHDATHDGPEIAVDLRLAWDILNPGGCLIVDDYNRTGLPKGHANNFDDMCDEVDKFAREKNIMVINASPKAILWKP